MISFFPIAVSVSIGLSTLEPEYRDILRSLGASQATIMRSNVWQLLLLALGGGLLGSLLGFLAQLGLAWLMRDLIGAALPSPGLSPAVLGMVTAVCILAGFALPDLAQMGKTPPLRVLHHDLEPPPLRYGIGWLAGVAAVLALLLWIMRDTRLVLTIFGGAAATFLALGAAGWLLVRSLHGFRGAAGVAWRYGLANIARRGRESVVQVVAFGLGLMVLGIFQKVVVADGLLAPAAEEVFGASEHVSFWDAWLGTLAFSGQIFCDFAGYSTTAIGVALTLGFSLPNNFRFPYAAIGFSDFWRRWHISLSTWLRDYLYVPRRTYVNLALVMLLGGLWHGAAWTFVAWGALHGLLLAVERARGKRGLLAGAPRPARVWTSARRRPYSRLSGKNRHRVPKTSIAWGQSWVISR